METKIKRQLTLPNDVKQVPLLAEFIDGIYKSDLKNFWSDMKDTFAEIKKLNDDMDKMLEQFERADKIFSGKAKE